MSTPPDVVETYPEAFASLGAMAITASITQAILEVAIGQIGAMLVVIVPAAWIIYRAAPHWPGAYDE